MTSIAVVVLDTLRYDHFDQFDWIPGQKFTNAYSTSHWTIPAHASLFTGKYPSEVGVHAKSPSLDCPGDTLPEILQETGYTTRCYTANAMLSFTDGWSRGFDQFVPRGSINPDHNIDWSDFMSGLDDDEDWKLLRAVNHCIKSDSPTLTALIEGFEEWRDSGAEGGMNDIINRVKKTDFGDNEFVLFNTVEAHTPYHAPKDNSSVNYDIYKSFDNSIENEEYICAAYRRSVEYLNKKYQKLFPILTDKFDYVITLSDHGELLGENKFWHHVFGVYPQLTHIPIVVSGDGIKNKTRHKTASILDVHKTITDLIGIPIESRGQNLIDNDKSEDRLIEYHGLIPWHYETLTENGVEYGYYDKPLSAIITSEGNYGYETINGGFIVRSEGEKKKMISRYEEIKSSIDRRNVNVVDENVEAQAKSRLEELGYV